MMRAFALGSALAAGLWAAAHADERGAAFLADLVGHDVVLLGEVHGNPAHHRLQAQGVAALAPAAIVWEMLTPEQAAGLPDDLRDASALARLLEWDQSGWPDFALYHPIMLAAPGALHLGAEITRGQTRLVFEQPLAAVFEALFDQPAQPLGITTPLDDTDQAAREAMQAAAHCDALPEDLLPGMVDAQRLRDAALAAQVLAALDRTGGPVAVITGAGHVRRDIGVPRKLAHAAPDLRVLSLAMLEAEPGPDAPFDRWIVTDAPSRADPCAAFD